MTLDTNQSLPFLVTNSYLHPGLSVPVPLILVYFEGLVDRAPADVHPAIAERSVKAFYD